MQKSEGVNLGGGGNFKSTKGENLAFYLGIWGLGQWILETPRSHFRLFYCVSTD